MDVTSRRQIEKKMNIYEEILMRNTKEKCINEMNIYVIKMLYFNEVRKAKERKIIWVCVL